MSIRLHDMSKLQHHMSKLQHDMCKLHSNLTAHMGCCMKGGLSRPVTRQGFQDIERGLSRCIKTSKAVYQDMKRRCFETPPFVVYHDGVSRPCPL
mmetsp:Transcript_96672/g.155943  ORF Transcript_96672/g.155943 Transcript_96672/m.155943 type:complete len:95 (+) Transcript_96672:1394-1678(+)